MEDIEIIGLFLSRSDNAIQAVSEKYEGYCFAIANNILNDSDASYACVCDAWQAAWDGIPPHEPDSLPAYLGSLTRSLAIQRWRQLPEDLQARGRMRVALDELCDCIPSDQVDDRTVDPDVLSAYIKDFLNAQKPADKNMFICRYWYFDSEPEIAKQFGLSRSRVASRLYRLRMKLLNYMEERGIYDEA